LRGFPTAVSGLVLFACLLCTDLAVASDAASGEPRYPGFWSVIHYAGIVLFTLCIISFNYILYLRKKKASRIKVALQHERAYKEQPPLNSPPEESSGDDSGQDFSAVKSVDPETGKTTYDMHPVSRSHTEVGTFAYVLLVAGFTSMLPVYGLIPGIIVTILAPVAARRFTPSLERVVGMRLILLSVTAAGIGAITSLLSASVALSSPPYAECASQRLSLPPDVPMYVPFALLGALVVSVVMHEVAHGLSAYWCGDSTAKKLGRLTLNPVKHFDMFGSFILPALLLFATGFKFAVGYAKPVPINPGRFGQRRRDSIITATAGASANFMLCAAALALLVAISFIVTHVWPDAQISCFSEFLRAPVFEGVPAPLVWSVVVQVLKSFFVVNLVLGILNLIPIPPFDGSFVLENLLPRSIRIYFRLLRLFSLGLLVILTAIIILTPLFSLILKLVLRTSDLIYLVTHLH
jgi:Zn-dependent protease